MSLQARDAVDRDRNAVEFFRDLLISGFENPESLSGSVQCRFPSRPDLDFVAVFGRELCIVPGSRETADTIVSMPLATVHRIQCEFEYLDWRDPEVIGTITFEGNSSLANHLAKSCTRPSEWTQARFRNAERRHRVAGFADLDEVERIACPTQKHVLAIMSENRPVVLTDVIPESTAGPWTLERLVDRYADAVVRVRSASHRQTMRAFVDELRSFESSPYDNTVEGFVKPYTEGAALPLEMWPDFGPLYFDREEYIPPQLWLGSVPTHIPSSSLHRDPRTGCLLQVIGRKRLDLYSADQADRLYPMKAYNNYQPCWFKPEAPDFNRYPKARDARRVSVVLEPGELLIQPAGWFHQVYALDSPNMSVSYFWRY